MIQRLIAQITDLHLDETHQFEYGVDPRRNWALILEDVQARGIKDIVFTGDIGEHDAYKWFFETLAPFHFDVIPGNHDVSEMVMGIYRPHFLEGKSEMFHSKEDAIFKYIFLDTAANELSNIQCDWLASALETDKKIVVFLHHPVLKVRTAIDSKYPLLNRDHARKILEESGKEITIFSGHYHTSDATKAGNITQYVTPGASVQYEKGTDEVRADNGFFGYRLIAFDGEDIRTSLVLNKFGEGFEEYPDF